MAHGETEHHLVKALAAGPTAGKAVETGLALRWPGSMFVFSSCDLGIPASKTVRKDGYFIQSFYNKGVSHVTCVWQTFKVGMWLCSASAALL